MVHSPTFSRSAIPMCRFRKTLVVNPGSVGRAQKARPARGLRNWEDCQI